MPELLKHRYNQSFFDRFSSLLNHALPHFDKDAFLEKIYDSDWEQRELKARMKHIAAVLHNFLPNNFEEAMPFILEIKNQAKKGPLAGLSLEFMFLPEYIEQFGLEYFDESVKGMEQITPFTSCEFAVRPFIIKYPQKMIEKMLVWSAHENHHVRRLASEGCRPRLPWAIALPEFKKDPQPVLPILENLKTDPSEYVRRSVANNLNDIAKDHPELVIEFGTRWKGTSDETDRIVKHGCRTLLKKGHSGALKLFGFDKPENVDIEDFQVDRRVKIGDKLSFGFSLVNLADEPIKLRLEYGIDYMKSNGSANRKIFKITEKNFLPGEVCSFTRSQSFRNMTTRKHYPGQHSLAIILNGLEIEVRKFEVIEPG